MKSAPSFRHWCLLLVVVLVLGSAMIRGAPVFAALAGSVTSVATPSNATPDIGQQIAVSININMSDAPAPNHALGSFTGSLDWDPAILAYNSNSGIPAGFTGVVNVANAGTGHISFNGANASGATGNVMVLTITFNVVAGGTSALDLGYSAMAAATTFTNLRPVLTVNDGEVVAGGPARVTLVELEARPGFGLWAGGAALALAVLGLVAAGWFLARRRTV